MVIDPGVLSSSVGIGEDSASHLELTYIRIKYCKGDNSGCARYMVFKALGREEVPLDLYPNQVILNIIYGMLCPSYPHAAVILNSYPLRQIPMPRITASHFHPASKLTGIQLGFL